MRSKGAGDGLDMVHAGFYSFDSGLYAVQNLLWRG
jgi:hypothetical protein